MERHTNTFKGGMVQDLDAQFKGSDTYLRSENGRILYNEDGTLSFCNDKGNKLSFSLTSGYLVLGWTSVQDYLIILSGNQTNSEIGFVKEDVFGQAFYTVAFNDTNDPNGKQLNFSAAHNIEVVGEYENDTILNIYFNDFYNDDRAFNILAGASFNYTTPYPSWYSVASMSAMIDFTPDIVQYKKTIVGSLPVGKYQYCYQLVHENGYETPYTIPSQLITITSDDVSATDWLQYQMTNSGANSNKGVTIKIGNIDTKFKQIKLIAIYWENDTTPTNAFNFLTTDITTSVFPFVSMEFNHLTQSGLPITTSEINQTFADIRKSKTIAIFENALHKGNVVLGEKIEIDTDNFQIYPALRNILPDTTGSTTSLPFTNQTPSNTYVGSADNCKPIDFVDALGAIHYKEGTMDNEYYNYKGTQIENRTKSAFRGETYPIGFLAYDMKGQPMYVNHIADVGMPQQYADESDTDTKTYFKKLSGTTYTTEYIDMWDCINAGTLSTTPTTNKTFKLTETDTIGGAYNVSESRTTLNQQTIIRPLGLIINNIDLTSVLYDADGKQQISGFSIVAMPRYENIAFQGAMKNVYQATGINYEQVYEAGNLLGTTSVDNLSVIHTPDKEFDGGIAVTNNDNCRIHVLGAAYNSIWNTDNYIVSVHSHQLSKDYQTGRIDTASGGSSRYYNSNMPSNSYHTVGDIALVSSPPQSSSLLGVNIYNGIADIQCFTSQYSAIVSHTIASPYPMINGGEPNPSFPVIPIVNYELGITSPDITESELQGRIYRNIGHYIPLTAQNIADCTDGSNNVIFNGVEVFGFDCYPSMVDYCRLIPYENATADPNCGRILVYPCESKYNCDMRYGNQSAKVATKDVTGNATFPNGILMTTLSNNLEQWDLNSVMLASDNWRLSYPKPSITEIDRQPLLHYFSNFKVIGEKEDAYRIFLPLNFNNVDGRYGEINKMFTQFNNLYLLQTSAFCQARFQERALVATTLGDLSTGTGVGLQGYAYISKDYGTQHRFAFCQSGKSTYWIDSYKGKLLKFSQAGVDTPSLNAYANVYFTNKTKDYWKVPETYDYLGVNYDVNNYYRYNAYIDNPSGINKISSEVQTGVGGITMVYDYKNESVIIGFTDVYISISPSGTPASIKLASKETIEYNEVKNAFVDYPTYYSNMFMQFKRMVYMNNSVMNNNSVANAYKIYKHNQGVRGSLFGVNKNTKLKFTVAPMLGVPKYFHNGRLNVNESGVSLLSQVVASTQNLASQTIVLNNSSVDKRPQWLEGILRYPIMAKGQKQRLRDKYLTLEFTIANDGSDKLVQITEHTTMFAPSPQY